MDFLAQFGYFEVARSPRGELVLAKMFRPRDESVGALDYHVRYGPPAVSCNASAFVVPIKNHWHNQLFPECTMSLAGTKGQLAFPDFAGDQVRPWGNALRKAYLCNASIKRMEPGDIVLFYRSGFKTVEVIGVVEEALRTGSAEEAMNFVGGRTVYSAEDVGRLARHKRQVLVIMFRRDWVLDEPWSLTELQFSNVLNGPPQTVQRVK